ncbi:hypothetical protein [Cupriavidus necator]
MNSRLAPVCRHGVMAAARGFSLILAASPAIFVVLCRDQRGHKHTARQLGQGGRMTTEMRREGDGYEHSVMAAGAALG